ncbi:hypothetical protein SDC9_178111 [bioreactor metagenome]|uniref:Peptidoglycan O-acetyltransferase n=1 Tax=bioreactor metagenome TaxID=1076179 RepID=A0A645GWA9_9ZZZZ
MFGMQVPAAVGFSVWYYLDAYNIFIIVLGVFVSLGLPQMLANKFAGKVPKVAGAVQKISLIGLFVLCGISVVTSSYNPFIYFRF